MNIDFNTNKGCALQVDREIIHWNVVIICTPSFLHVSQLIVDCISPPHQMTPLHLAAKGGRIKSLTFLVGKGANINTQDDNGVIMSYQCLQIS